MIAQSTNASTRNCTSGHARARHVLMHVIEKSGGPPPMPPPPKSTQPSVHVRTSPHVTELQAPQSSGQFTHVSKPMSVSQRMFGQNEHVPQSRAQLLQFSVPSQRPLPQPVQTPQSIGHVEQFSMPGSQVRSPQRGHAPQSGWHVRQSSPRAGSQKPFSHVSQMPQSPGQLRHVSVPSQRRLPHVSQRPQSTGHVLHVSLG